MFSVKVFILVAFIVSVFLLEKFTRKKWNIQKKTYAYHYVNDMHKWIDVGIITVYLIAAMTCIFVFENFMLSFYIMVTFLVTQWSVRIWIEWKYDRESKEYMITIGSMGSAFAVVLLTWYLFFY